jgi:hypothetical protein
MLRFLNLYLLSQHERRGLSVRFNSLPTVIQAGNGFGKSAVVKSLYETFGAEPHRVDGSWRSARVSSVVEFSVEGKQYAILKTGGSYAVFDERQQLLIRTVAITRDLSPFLAKLFDFQLVMSGHDDDVVIPPPAYIFAPFYIDQDQSWTKPWESFTRMHLPDSKRILADYHSGLRPNAYYEAKARQALLRSERKVIEAERGILDQTLRGIQTLVSDVVLSYDLQDFKEESSSLLEESNRLHNEQARYRQRLAEIADERRLWVEQRDLVKTALAEMDAVFAAALERPSEIACPTCGQHYDNSIAEQFSLVEDTDGLYKALVTSTDKLHELEGMANAERANIDKLSDRIATINHILGVRKTDLSFRDVVAAEGRNEAARIIRHRIADTDAAIGEKRRLEDAEDQQMRTAVSRKRSQEIREFFYERLERFAIDLDVRLEDTRKAQLSSVSLRRGSEGPRGLMIYYYAFLQTARQYSSSAFCPIVIDAPNQQGQDTINMPHMMRFILDEKPADSQVIIAAEQLFGVAASEVDLVEVGKRNRQVLREEDYVRVSELIRPYLGQLI